MEIDLGVFWSTYDVLLVELAIENANPRDVTLLSLSNLFLRAKFKMATTETEFRLHDRQQLKYGPDFSVQIYVLWV